MNVVQVGESSVPDGTESDRAGYAKIEKWRDEMKSQIKKEFAPIYRQVETASRGASRNQRRLIKAMRRTVRHREVLAERMLQRSFKKMIGAYNPDTGTLAGVQAEAAEMIAELFNEEG